MWHTLWISAKKKQNKSRSKELSLAWKAFYVPVPIQKLLDGWSILLAYQQLQSSPREVIDENSWSDVEYIRSSRTFAGPYFVTKTLAEKAAIDLAEKLGLDLVSVLPTWISGPFICPNIPDTVRITMALIFGDQGHYKHVMDSSLVHVDDVARAHIHLFEHLEAKGRYIVSAVEYKIDEQCEFISGRYPEYKMPRAASWKDIVIPVKFSGLSTKKLEETGFKYENGLEQVFDGAIKCCKDKGFL